MSGFSSTIRRSRRSYSYGYGTAGMKIPEGYLTIKVDNESGQVAEQKILYPANPGSRFPSPG